MRKSGITLIALIITIIVLLILAGISLSFLLGDNGILSKAQTSKEKTVIGEEIDLISLAYNGAYTELLGEGIVTYADMNNQFAINGTNATARGANPIRVIFNETGHEYTVIEGKVEYAGIYVAPEPTLEDFFTITEDGVLGIVENTSKDPEGMGYYYNDEGEKILSTNNIVIPETINGIVVKTIPIAMFSNAWSLESVILPSTLESIGYKAFMNCKSLSQIEIPNNVTKIGAVCFAGCTDITYVKLSESITEIAGSVFYNCSSLNNIEISDNVTIIRSQAFSNCISLKDVKFSEHLATIGQYAFMDCESIENISFPDSLEEIQENAFLRCSGLKQIFIPKNVSELGDGWYYTNPFIGCCNITKIEVDENNSHFDSRNNCNAIMQGSNLIAGCQNTIIPDDTSLIRRHAFCGQNFETINIPHSVNYIYFSAFTGCRNIGVINYQGTLEEWNRISKPTQSSYTEYYTNWLKDVKIICTDGTINE